MIKLEDRLDSPNSQEELARLELELTKQLNLVQKYRVNEIFRLVAATSVEPQYFPGDIYPYQHRREKLSVEIERVLQVEMEIFNIQTRINQIVEIRTRSIRIVS